MPWNGSTVPWNQASINHVPAISGVYAIWRPGTWVFIGETNDLRHALMEHFGGDNACITQSRPTTFGYEAHPEGSRVERQHELIAELRPTCD